MILLKDVMHHFIPGSHGINWDHSLTASYTTRDSPKLIDCKVMVEQLSGESDPAQRFICIKNEFENCSLIDINVSISYTRVLPWMTFTGFWIMKPPKHIFQLDDNNIWHILYDSLHTQRIVIRLNLGGMDRSSESLFQIMNSLIQCHDVQF